MENLLNNAESDNQLLINNEIKVHLIESSKWAKFLAIVGFVGLGFLILVALFMLFGFSKISKFGSPGFNPGLIGLIYLPIAVLYFFPIYYLLQFSQFMKKGLEAENISSTTLGFRYLKSFFRFMGIFVIVVLSIYALALVVMIPVTMMLIK
jgi:hypothetical protein